jgi:hypothetical protein
MGVLGECLALALQQVVTRFSSFQLGLHDGQRLPRGKDSLPVLQVALV